MKRIAGSEATRKRIVGLMTSFPSPVVQRKQDLTGSNRSVCPHTPEPGTGVGLGAGVTSGSDTVAGLPYVKLGTPMLTEKPFIEYRKGLRVEYDVSCRSSNETPKYLPAPIFALMDDAFPLLPAVH